jgi:hypothetical protein
VDAGEMVMSDEAIGDLLRVSGHVIHHTRRQAGLLEQLQDVVST